MEALLERSAICHAKPTRDIPHGLMGQLWVNGSWAFPDELDDDTDSDPGDPLSHDLAYGGIDGEEFMGTGTAFETDESGPVYHPAGS